MLIEALELAWRWGSTVVVVGLPGGVGTADCLRQAEALRSKGERLEVRRIVWRNDGLAGEAHSNRPHNAGLRSERRHNGSREVGSKGRAHQEGARWTSG